MLVPIYIYVIMIVWIEFIGMCRLFVVSYHIVFCRVFVSDVLNDVINKYVNEEICREKDVHQMI